MNTHVKPDRDEVWRIGAAALDITPAGSVFLYGYPHVPRMSTAVHDPLLASALWIEHAGTVCLFLNCDLIWLPRKVTWRVRQALSAELGLPTEAIMITATHTHSGPVTTRMLSNTTDPVVPPPDAAYMEQVEEGLLDVARAARDAARPAQLAIAHLASQGLGGNRHDPAGPTLERWPVLYATAPGTDQPFAVMSICAMHPTVLHADSTVISGDFPGLARQALQHTYGQGCVYLHHMGASGNQSPRHVTREKTLAEAKRLGDLLAGRIHDTYPSARILPPAPIRSVSRAIDLPLRNLPTPKQATQQRDAARQRLDRLRRAAGDPATIRSAEVDWFGAEETCTLAAAAKDGKLRSAAEACLPAEVQVIGLGDQALVGWPGEVFVEFALWVMSGSPHAHVITLANGDLEGYLVTQDAIDRRTYESGNAIFASPASAERLTRATVQLLDQLNHQSA